MFVMILGAALMGYAGLMQFLNEEEEKKLTAGGYFQEWKIWAMDKMTVKNMTLPNWGWSLGVTVVVLLFGANASF